MLPSFLIPSCFNCLCFQKLQSPSFPPKSWVTKPNRLCIPFGCYWQLRGNQFITVQWYFPQQYKLRTTQTASPLPGNELKVISRAHVLKKKDVARACLCHGQLQMRKAEKLSMTVIDAVLQLTHNLYLFRKKYAKLNGTNEAFWASDASLTYT